MSKTEILNILYVRGVLRKFCCSQIWTRNMLLHFSILFYYGPVIILPEIIILSIVKPQIELKTDHEPTKSILALT